MSGIIWRGAGNAKAMAYGYTYDKSGRLTQADFRRFEPPGGSYPGWAWRTDIVDYTLNSVAYDILYVKLSSITTWFHTLRMVLIIKALKRELKR
jgi:hypothetical protein